MAYYILGHCDLDLFMSPTRGILLWACSSVHASVCCIKRSRSVTKENNLI